MKGPGKGRGAMILDNSELSFLQEERKGPVMVAGINETLSKNLARRGRLSHDEEVSFVQDLAGLSRQDAQRYK